MRYQDQKTVKAYLAWIVLRAPVNYRPYYELWAEVILSGVESKGYQFFGSERFEYICELIGADKDVILDRLPQSIKRGLENGSFRGW